MINFLVKYFVSKIYFIIFARNYTYYMQTIGAKIVKIRKEKGLTQYRLSKLSGVTQRHLHFIEGGMDCKVSTLQKILKALDTQITIP